MIDIGNNLTAVIIATLGLIGSVVTAVLSYQNKKGIAEVKDGMQSRMIEAKQAESVALGRAEGMAAGEEKEKARNTP